MLIDTGSSNLAIAGSDNEMLHRHFQYHNSSTYVYNGKPLKVTYTQVCHLAHITK